MNETPPLLIRLRDHTRMHHCRLEQTVDVSQRCETAAGYRSLLKRFYGFYAPLEAAMERQEAWQRLGFEQRRKTPWLRHDLLLLGETAPELLPQCADLPRQETLGHLLGTAYVLEGATLGGQLIARHVNSHLGLTAETGAAFFHSYGPEVGRMWKAFHALLAVEAEDRTTQEDAITAACDTFTALETWFSKPERGKGHDDDSD